MTTDPAEAPTPRGTPNQYRYAKAHLRAALAHLRLAEHYMASQVTGIALANQIVHIQTIHNVAEARSLEKDPTP